MLPYFAVRDFIIPTGFLTFLSACFSALVILRIRHRQSPLWYQLFLVAGASTGAIWGAYIFQWLFDVSQGSHTAAFFAGRVFYGGLLGGAVVIYLILKRLPPAERWLYWNSAAICCAFAYGWMRIGCFLNGCCWGQPSSVPWAVTFTHDHTSAGLVGVPVHPVQLYDSILGFAIAPILINQRSQRNLVFLFLLLYSVGRFFTEFFRGDSERGLDWPLNLSTSQWLSVFLFIALGLYSLKAVTKEKLCIY